MDITKLAKKPKVTRLEITEQDIIDKYKEPIVFYMLDELDLSTYFEFYKLQHNQESALLNDLLRRLILKEDGTPALAQDEIFPVDIILAVLVRINDFLGKKQPEVAKEATSETGNSPN